jgi:SpoVK/Ycf46/Vps4 family AAA+-type ATPase
VVVTRRLGPVRAPVAEDVGITRPTRREDIVGLDDVLERLERLFLVPPSPSYALFLGEADRAQTGAVLVGGAGCGKSMVADYLVGRVRAAGGRALVRTASSYLSRWVGGGASRLRSDFAALDRAWEETGVRPLLVVDELEAIALDRSQGHMLHGGYLDVLDTFLALLTRSRARMIGISNVGDKYLDAALVRDGRLPIVQFPATLDAPQVATLVARCLARIPLAGNGGAW